MAAADQVHDEEGPRFLHNHAAGIGAMDFPVVAAQVTLIGDDDVSPRGRPRVSRGPKICRIESVRGPWTRSKLVADRRGKAVAVLTGEQSGVRSRRRNDVGCPGMRHRGE